MRLYTDFQEKLASLLSTASFFVVFYNYSDNRFANNTKVSNFGLQNNNEKMLVSCQKAKKTLEHFLLLCSFRSQLSP